MVARGINSARRIPERDIRVSVLWWYPDIPCGVGKREHTLSTGATPTADDMGRREQKYLVII
jgi:hypothetical protein